MSIKERFTIREIPNNIGGEVVKKYHYLHRKAPTSYAFGIFRDKPYDESLMDVSNSNVDGKRLAGVLTYGTPCSAPLRRGICGEEEKKNVIELNRLWTRDCTPQNLESYFIMNTVDELDKEIVVSYADTEEGHLGTIYQACGWYYTGTSAERYDWKVEGLDVHSHTLADKYTASELRDKYGDRFYKEKRSVKHRYVYFNCNSVREKELKEKLNYDIISDYPKKLKNDWVNVDEVELSPNDEIIIEDGKKDKVEEVYPIDDMLKTRNNGYLLFDEVKGVMVNE